MKLSANWWRPPVIPAKTRLFTMRGAPWRSIFVRNSASVSLSARIRCRLKTTWSDHGTRREVTAPLSLIVSAFAPVTDARLTLTPQLRTDAGDTVLICSISQQERRGLGGSALAQVYGTVGSEAPDVDDPALLRNSSALFRPSLRTKAPRLARPL